MPRHVAALRTLMLLALCLPAAGQDDLVDEEGQAGAGEAETKPVEKTWDHTPAISSIRGAPRRRGGFRLLIPNDLPLEYVWSIPFEQHKVRRGGIDLFGKYLLVITTDHFLYKVRKHDGVIMWVVQLRKALDRGMEPVLTRRGVYLVIDNEILFIDADEGEIVWKLEPDFPMSSTPIVIEPPPTARKMEPDIYVTGWDKRFYGLTVKSKSRLLVKGRTPDSNIVDLKYWITEKWHINAKDHVVSTPAYRDNVFFFGGEDRNLYAITREGRSVNYRIGDEPSIRTPIFTAQAGIRSTPVVKTSRIYLGADDQFFYALDRAGNPDWKFGSPSVFVRSPYVDLRSNVVLVYSYKNGVYGLREKDGRQLWHQRDAMDLLTASPAKYYIAMTGRSAGSVAALDKQTGKILWSSKLAGIKFAGVTPNEYMDRDAPMRLYLVTENNILLTFKERERDFGPWTPGAGLAPRGERGGANGN